MLPNSLDISRSEEIILNVLYDRECYGLEIKQIVNQASNGENPLNFGSLYPALRKLNKKGLVQSRWGDERPLERRGARRKYYTITLEGKKTVDSFQEFRQKLRVLQLST